MRKQKIIRNFDPSEQSSRTIIQNNNNKRRIHQKYSLQLPDDSKETEKGNFAIKFHLHE